MNPKASNALLTVGQPILVNLLAVPATAFIIRSLGAEQYGQWAVATALVAAFFALTSMGLRPIFVRELAQSPDCTGEALSLQLGLRGVLGLLSSAAALGLCLLLGYPTVILISAGIMVAAFLMTNFWTVFSDVLQAAEQFKTIAVVNTMSGVCLTAASVLAAIAGVGPVGLAASYLVGPMLRLVFGWAAVRRITAVRFGWQLDTFGRLLRESRFMAGQQTLQILQGHIEQIIVPKLVGVAPFGYLAAGSMPADRLRAIPEGIASSYYPIIARDQKTSAAAAGQTAGQLIMLCVISCVPIAVLLSFFAGPIAELLFPNDSEVCRSILRITIWSVPLFGLTLPMTYSLQAAGRYSEAAKSVMWGCMVSVGVTVALVSIGGLQGACWAWIARQSIIAAALAPEYLRTFPAVRLPVIRIAACAAIMFSLLWLVSLIHMRVIPEIGTGGILGGAVYLASLTVLKVIPPHAISHLFRRSAG